MKNLAKDRSRSDGATSAKPLNINTSFKKKQQENRTTVPVNSLVEYRGEQPFDDYKDTEQFDALMESISTEGLANPITVREIGDGKYEIVSGHHRSEVFRRLGKTDIPAVVYPKDTPEDMIVAAMINGNTLNGRASLKVSEKCKALLLYSKVLERRQGLRTDMFSNDDFDDEIESDKNYDIYEQLRIKFNEGHRSTVVRLLKAAKDMPPDILDKVDNKEIGFMVAYKVMQQSDKKFRDELYSHIREGKKLTESSLNTLIDAYNTRKEAKILEEQMKKEAEQERLENQRHKEELAKKSVEQDNSDDDIDTVNQEGVHSES
ncbi:ParB N-terminal domain-containing protein, partial [Tyzzerella sp. OttesenSCG-928-J15]|nr:ParB N-terminal domain-containing protein [Tyzzerella sp. OttesenSCG-928-J15]